MRHDLKLNDANCQSFFFFLFSFREKRLALILIADSIDVFVFPKKAFLIKSSFVSIREF